MNSCAATTNHSEASTALNSGVSPRSGKRLGSMPSDTVAGPCRENRRGGREVRARERQSAHRDERVASPIGEPRIAGDDRMPALAAHDVRRRRRAASGGSGVRRAASRTRIRAASAAASAPMPSPARSTSTASSAARSKVKVPGGGQILGAIKTACRFFAVEKVAVPGRRVRVARHWKARRWPARSGRDAT